MNKTELKAFKWLQKQGYTNVIHQGRKTPDFRTSGGFFEVKLAYGHTLNFTSGQVEKIVGADAKVLVFDDDHDDPVLTVDPDSLEQGLISGFIIRITKPSNTISVAEDIYIALVKIAADLSVREGKRISIDEAIRYLMTFNPTLKIEETGLRRTY